MLALVALAGCEKPSAKFDAVAERSNALLQAAEIHDQQERHEGWFLLTALKEGADSMMIHTHDYSIGIYRLARSPKTYRITLSQRPTTGTFLTDSIWLSTYRMDHP